MPSSLAVCVAGGVGVFSVGLTAFVMRSGSVRRLGAVPASLKSFISGLLTGMGMLVMLPLAMEDLTQDWPFEHVMLVFCSAPMLMFFFNHVVLDHQHLDEQSCAHSHSHGTSTTIVCGQTPKRISFNKVASPTFCPVTTVGNDMPQKPNANLKAACMERLSVLFGAVPYAVHAAVDGSILGTAHSPIMLASLTIPISLCAVQDVGTIIVSLSATKATDRDIFATASCFGIGFPVGASLMTALAGASSTSDADGDSLPSTPVPWLPAFAAGLFLYMALFELAPPHAHGRKASFHNLLAFAGGLATAYVMEAMESWATDMAEGLAPGGDLQANLTSDALVGSPRGRRFDGIAVAILVAFTLALVAWCCWRCRQCATSEVVVHVTSRIRRVSRTTAHAAHCAREHIKHRVQGAKLERKGGTRLRSTDSACDSWRADGMMDVEACVEATQTTEEACAL